MLDVFFFGNILNSYNLSKLSWFFVVLLAKELPETSLFFLAYTSEKIIVLTLKESLFLEVSLLSLMTVFLGGIKYYFFGYGL